MLDYIKEDKKTFRFYTLGCKVNQYDSQALREKFNYAGFSESLKNKSADICIINTCTVTSKADSKSRGLIRRAIKDNPGAEVVVTGCYAKENRELLNRIKGVDLVVENDRRDSLLELINSPLPKINRQVPLSSFDGHTRAFVKVQDGCDNFCSYCKVPYVRGRSRSRDASQIKLEVENLAKNGFKEIVLCGICLGDFGKGLPKKTNLVELIEELERIPGLERIRLSSIEAKDITDQLIERIASSDKLCRHLHIPFQSGDDKILKLMNRNYTERYYMSLVDKIKKNIKDVAITADIIAGFPGESEENFKNTTALLKEVMPLRTHIFPFSPRRGTKAYSFKNRVADNIAKERTTILKDVTTQLSLLYCRGFLNRELDVLVESSIDKKHKSFKGYSSNYISIFINSNRSFKECINNVVKVKVTKIINGDTWGEIVN